MEKWEKDLVLINQRADAFSDTMKMCEENPRLAESVKLSRRCQKVIPETESIRIHGGCRGRGEVKVTANSTLEAAAAYNGKHVAVLNFGAFFRPAGGRMEKGRSNTQEDCLCRTSTLYPCINDEKCKEQFYTPHKAVYTDLFNGDLIYTPDVTVFKSGDGTGGVMDERDWFETDVITMAAPNESTLDTKHYRQMEDEFKTVFDARFSRVMAAAVTNNVEVLILGAFGCGTFGNDPAVVATGAARALEKFVRFFDTVEFAIPSKPKPNNFRMFRLVLDRYINGQ